MKITLTISTNEPYSNRYNLFELLNMSLETIDSSKDWKRPTTGDFTITGAESYKYGVEDEDPRKARATVELGVVK